MPTKCLNYMMCKQIGSICYNDYCKNCFILFSHYIQGQVVYYKPTFSKNICNMCNTNNICIVMNLSKSSCQHILCQPCFNKYILSTISDEPIFPYIKSIENKYYDNPKLYYHDTKIINYFNEWNQWNRNIQKKKIEYHKCPICSHSESNHIYILSAGGLSIILYYNYWLLEYIIWLCLVYISRELLVILYY